MCLVRPWFLGMSVACEPLSCWEEGGGGGGRDEGGGGGGGGGERYEEAVAKLADACSHGHCLQPTQDSGTSRSWVDGNAF